MTKKIFLISLILVLLPLNLNAKDNIGRLGVGLTEQLKNGIPAVSFKLQRSTVYAIGGMLGLRFGDDDDGYGAGLKFYRIIFDEPQLNFYFAGMGALISRDTGGESKSGFQIDASFGSEFSFVGLDSLGFSFEFGISAYKLDSFTFETSGSHFIVAAIHFYL